MPNRYSPLAFIGLVSLFWTPGLLAQDANGEAAAPRIFFDCRGPECDDEYYRTEIPWVTWVRQQQDAHIHVIMTSQQTGANGREYQLDVIGREAYVDYEDQSLLQALPTDTQRERLDAVTYSLGLVFARFAQYAGFRNLVSLQAIQRPGGNRPRGLVSSDQVEDSWDQGNGNCQADSKGGNTANQCCPEINEMFQKRLSGAFGDIIFSVFNRCCHLACPHLPNRPLTHLGRRTSRSGRHHQYRADRRRHRDCPA